MKHLSTLLLISSLIPLPSSLTAAGLPEHWEVDLAAQPPQVFSLQRPRGEAYELEAVLKNHGKPFAPAITNACIYWQTNGMENLYWSAPASVSNNVLRATWLPSMDPGATTVRGYIGDPGHIYAAAFQFRFIASPGAVPNVLPLPTPVIDFATVTVLNPPWPTNDLGRVDGAARPLPPYLHAIDCDDTYPEDAAWFYALPHDYSSCSAVRDGGFLYRNYDWRFDDSAEFVVRVSAGDDRFASVGVANCGTNLTERIVTSGRWSRFYKCLPGRTVDGINENGVVAEVNVVGDDPHDRWPTNGTIHCMGAVRWVLDHATDAGTAASNLVDHLFFPAGFSQNFHWMIADATSTWIVENGRCSNVTGRAVMTNFPLLPTPGEGAGRERYELLLSSACCITNAWYTRAYSRETEWVSEFKSPAEMEAAKSAWETYGRDALRGKGLWQTVHCSVYDLTNRTLRVAVQERPDWYTFAVPGGTGVSPVQIREIVQPMIADATNAVPRIVSGVQEVRADLTAKVKSGWTNLWEPDASVVHSSPVEGDMRYEGVWYEFGYWVSHLYVYQGGEWVAFTTYPLDGDNTNPDATELTFPDGTVTRRVPATAETQLLTRLGIAAPSPDASTNAVAGAKATGDALAKKADSSELEPLSIGYQRIYSFQTSATNVNISVTNYPPTAEEAEGRTHFDPTAPDPDLDFSTVPASLRVDETRGGKRTVVDTRDWPFWFFTSKLPGILAAAREYAREAYTNALVSLAAWASRTATGAENPAGDSTLVVDVPNIWLMTDQTFEKHVAGSNSCWVIRSKNAAVSPGVATNGFLELTDAFGAPYIRFNKTEATFADPPADGISYDADAGEWLISYSTEAQPRGGANVALQGSADYPGKAILKEADDPLCPAVITWSGSARNWVMHARPKRIDGIDPGRMFFGAVVEIEGHDYIEYLKPVSFSHIVLPNGKKIAPDVPQSATVGSTVTWKVVL